MNQLNLGVKIMDLQYEQFKKEQLEKRKKIPNLKITLPLDMAELISEELERQSKNIGFILYDGVQPGDAYDEFVKQVKLQKSKLKPAK